MERVASALGRVPPQSIEAEQSTLGSMMIERSALNKGMEILRPEDFYRPAHQEIFDALLTLAERKEPCDLITMQEELRKRGKLEDCGGTEYLMALVDTVPTAANVEHYARIVEQKAILRGYIAAGTAICGMAQYDEDEIDIDELSDRVENTVKSIGERRSSPLDILRLEDLLDGDIPPIEWIIQGLVPRHGITIISGDSGVGKSWLVYAMALAVGAGTLWLGHFFTKKGRVLIGDVENGETVLKNRIRRLFTGLATDGLSVATDLPVEFYPHAIKFHTAYERRRLIRHLRDHRIDLCVVDPMVHSLPDNCDENKSTDMAHFFEQVREVQHETGTCFLFNHHTRKTNPNLPNDAGQSIRGSSAIKGVCDSHLAIRPLPGDESDKSTKLLMIEQPKSRHSPEMNPFTVRLEHVDEQAITIHYIAEAELMSATKVAATSDFLIRALADAGGSMWRKDIVAAAEANGVSERTVNRVLKAAVNAGDLEAARMGQGIVYTLRKPSILEGI